MASRRSARRPNDYDHDAAASAYRERDEARSRYHDSYGGKPRPERAAAPSASIDEDFIARKIQEALAAERARVAEPPAPRHLPVAQSHYQDLPPAHGLSRRAQRRLEGEEILEVWDVAHSKGGTTYVNRATGERTAEVPPGFWKAYTEKHGKKKQRSLEWKGGLKGAKGAKGEKGEKGAKGERRSRTGRLIIPNQQKLAVPGKGDRIKQFCEDHNFSAAIEERLRLLTTGSFKRVYREMLTDEEELSHAIDLYPQDLDPPTRSTRESTEEYLWRHVVDSSVFKDFKELHPRDQQAILNMGDLDMYDDPNEKLRTVIEEWKAQPVEVVEEDLHPRDDLR